MWPWTLRHRPAGSPAWPTAPRAAGATGRRARPPTDGESICRRRCRRRPAVWRLSCTTASSPWNRRRVSCAGRRSCPRRLTAARRETGSCSRKRQPSIAGSRSRSVGSCRSACGAPVLLCRAPRPPLVGLQFRSRTAHPRVPRRHPLSPPFAVDADGSPGQSLAWARAQTARGAGRGYRGVSLPWTGGRFFQRSDCLGRPPLTSCET